MSAAAVNHVRDVAASVGAVAEQRLAAAIGTDSRPGPDGAHDSGRAALLEADLVAAVVRTRTRLTVNFHPDRIDRNGRSVAESLSDDGRYRPQWETGLSNGGRFAVPGGPRARWEEALFGPVYSRGDRIRPIYGALDLTCDEHGGSPRFGSSYLVLAERCFDRATFCVGDSHLGPSDVGTIDEFRSIVAGVVESGVDGNGLGRGLSVSRLVRLFTAGPAAALSGSSRSGSSRSGSSRSESARSESSTGWSGSPAARNLDHYVEAQIHGPVELADDVTAVVLDPSYADTDVGDHVGRAAVRYGFDVRWHRGSVLRPADVPHGFRGSAVADLAAETAGANGLVDAAAIGRALARFPFTEPTGDGDPEDSNLQQYKKLWHCVLAFGTAPDGAGQIG